MPFPLPGDVKSMQLQTIRHCCRCHSISSLICVAVFVLHCADYEYNYFTQIRRICIFCIGHSGQPLKCTTTQKGSKWCSNIKTNNLNCCCCWCQRQSKQLSDIFFRNGSIGKEGISICIIGRTAEAHKYETAADVMVLIYSMVYKFNKTLTQYIVQ